MKNLYLSICILVSAWMFCTNRASAQQESDKNKSETQMEVRYDNWPTTLPSNASRGKNEKGANYVLIGTTWNHRLLRYFVANGTNDMANEVQALRDGFAFWSGQTRIAFIQVCNAGDADFEILWGVGDHGDGAPFDDGGISGTNVLAHTLGGPPPNSFGNQAGDIHFDDFETWTDILQGNAAQPIDLVTVAAHEAGHMLGLDHTSVGGSLMVSGYSGSHRFLAADDISGIQSLYGGPGGFITGPSNIHCTSTTQTLLDLPGGVSVTWSVSSGLAIVGGQGTQNVQVKALSSSASTATITATVSTGCETLTFSRSVTTGLPTITSLALNGNSSFPQAVNPNSNYTLSASTNDPSSTYSFSVVGGSGNMNVSLS